MYLLYKNFLPGIFHQYECHTIPPPVDRSAVSGIPHTIPVPPPYPDQTDTDLPSIHSHRAGSLVYLSVVWNRLRLCCQKQTFKSVKLQKKPVTLMLNTFVLSLKRKWVLPQISIGKTPLFRFHINDSEFKNASAFLLRDARHAKHDIFLLRISAILPEAISDGRLTPTTDINLLLAT